MHPAGLKIEIEGAIYRNQVEFNTFKFAFNENITEDFKKRLTDHEYYNKANNEFDMVKLKKELAQMYSNLKQKQLQLDAIDIYKDIDGVFCVHA